MLNIPERLKRRTLERLDGLCASDPSSSVQVKMVSVYSEQPTCAPPCLLEVSTVCCYPSCIGILFSKSDIKSVGHLETKSNFFNFILISPTCTSNVFKKASSCERTSTMRKKKNIYI